MTHLIAESSLADLRITYERAFRALLWRTGRRHLQRRVDRLMRKAEGAVHNGVPREGALQHVYRQARQRTIRRLLAWRHGQGEMTIARCRRVQGLAALLEQAIPESPNDRGPDFHCDAGLGGLARWLRAAGYDAAWWPDVDDDALLNKALSSCAILLTTDRPLAQRGLIAHGAIAAVLVPISLKKREQFAWTARQLDLPIGSPRCMACGGALRAVEKERLRERIPPRTYPWLDDYFACQRCEKLYWQGTHWSRIQAQLTGSS